jgi:hypothetical protein
VWRKVFHSLVWLEAEGGGDARKIVTVRGGRLAAASADSGRWRQRTVARGGGGQQRMAATACEISGVSELRHT